MFTPLRYPDLQSGRTKVSPAGSVTSSSDSHLDCHSLLSVSLRYLPEGGFATLPYGNKSCRFAPLSYDDVSPQTKKDRRGGPFSKFTLWALRPLKL